MWCCKCDNDLGDCTCEDMEERLAGISHLAWKRCKTCQKHHARCKCETPVWEIVGPNGIVSDAQACPAPMEP